MVGRCGPWWGVEACNEAFLGPCERQDSTAEGLVSWLEERSRAENLTDGRKTDQTPARSRDSKTLCPLHLKIDFSFAPLGPCFGICYAENYDFGLLFGGQSDWAEKGFCACLFSSTSRFDSSSARLGTGEFYETIGLFVWCGSVGST